MSPYRRNILVGITVIGGLALLAWMLLKFSGQTASLLTDTRATIFLTAPRADGISDGSAVYYLGVNVGQVTRVQRSDNGREVIIEARIDEHPPVPANVEAMIRAQGLISGGSAINLELTGDVPQGQLKNGDKLPAIYAGQGLLPPEFAELASELRKTSERFRESNLIEHLDESVIKAGKLLDSLRTYTEDPKMRQDIQAAVANLRQASDSATRISENLEKFSGNLEGLSKDASATMNQARTTIAKTEGHVDDLAKQMSGRLEQIAKVLEAFESVSAKIDEGQGTAGMLVNDPKLYQALVDSAQQLSLTVADLKRLVEQWEQEGVSLKLR